VYKPDLIHGGFMLDHTTRNEVLAAVHTMAAAAVCAVTAAAATATVAAGATAATVAAGAAAAPCAAAAVAVTAAAGAAACALTSSSSDDADADQQQQQWQQPDLRRRSFCSSSFSSSRLPVLHEWDVANMHSSLSASCSSAAGTRRSSAVDQASKQLRERLAKQCAHLGLEVDAAAAAAATMAAAAATAARTALIAAAAECPAALLSAYSPEVAEWQQQQPLAVERRNTVH
jgi:hypothetical protein